MIRAQVNVEEEFWNRLDEIATEWKRTGKTDRHAGAGSGKHIFLGHFKTERKAALAYNKAARELFGEFARLNKVR